MKFPLAAFLLAIVVSGFSLAGINHFGAGLTVNASDPLNVQLDIRYDGQTSLTNEKVHTSPYSAKLVIPIDASLGSCAIALYPYNGTLNSISTFSVYASYVNATPRFVIYLDKNNDGVSESILLSDYQSPSNGEWKVTTGGNRWGWTEANYQLSSYGTTWKQLDSWKNDYGNAKALYVGIALEYWAVDPDGFDEPLYVDELMLDGGTPTYAFGSLEVQLDNVYDGQASLTNEKVHTSPKSVRLIIPKNASQASYAMALYPYNGTLNSISSFSIFSSYTYAVPRFMLCLEQYGRGRADTFLLSDYQFPSNGEWKATTGGNRWGWTETNIQLTSYGSTWDTIDYWVTKYGDLKVLYIGILLEYWAVDPDGFGEPLYADELIINGVTYNIQPATGSPSASPSPSPSPSPTPSPTPTPNATSTPSPSPIPVPGQSFFTVESNSTVSELFFNSTSSELSFTVTGPPETAGYVKVTIAKSLVSSVQSVKAYLDGNQLDVAITEDADSWLLSFTYMHSTHKVMISLATNTATTTFLGIENWIWVSVVITIVVIGAGLLVYFETRFCSE